MYRLYKNKLKNINIREKIDTAVAEGRLRALNDGESYCIHVSNFKDHPALFQRNVGSISLRKTEIPITWTVFIVSDNSPYLLKQTAAELEVETTAVNEKIKVWIDSAGEIGKTEMMGMYPRATTFLVENVLLHRVPLNGDMAVTLPMCRISGSAIPVKDLLLGNISEFYLIQKDILYHPLGYAWVDPYSFNRVGGTLEHGDSGSKQIKRLLADKVDLAPIGVSKVSQIKNSDQFALNILLSTFHGKFKGLLSEMVLLDLYNHLNKVKPKYTNSDVNDLHGEALGELIYSLRIK